MMPAAMMTLLRESLPAPAWRRSLSEDGSKRYLELRRDDAPALRALGLNPDDLGPNLVACMWDEDGDMEVGGFLVVDNLEAGTPSMGGIRLGPDIAPKVIHDLARGMTLKNAAAGLPCGGGKSGIVASRDLARAEHDDDVRGFARLLQRYRDIYNPGPDVGTDDADMRTVATENGLDAVVSKPKEMGGVCIDEYGGAAGGVVVALETALEELPKLRGLPQFRDLQAPAPGETTVLIQGFGAVGANAAMIVQSRPEGRRPRIVGISDADGCLTCDDGLPVPELFEHWRSSRRAVLPYALEHGLGKGPLDSATLRRSPSGWAATPWRSATSPSDAPRPARSGAARPSAATSAKRSTCWPRSRGCCRRPRRSGSAWRACAPGRAPPPRPERRAARRRRTKRAAGCSRAPRRPRAAAPHQTRLGQISPRTSRGASRRRAGGSANRAAGSCRPCGYHCAASPGCGSAGRRCPLSRW